MSNIMFSPYKIGNEELKNRFIMTPAQLSYATDSGKITDSVIDFYRARAKGGVGLIIVGAVGVDPTRIATSGVIQLCRDDYMEGMKKLVNAVHEEGGKIFPQLWHPGAYAKPREYNGQQAVAPSEYFCMFTQANTQALTISEIEKLTNYFADAALRAKQVGFDGLELVGSAGYIIAQFLSGATNKRTDKYGGDLMNRMTFLKEVIAAVRDNVGSDFPIIVRLAGKDMIPDGNSNDDCIQVAKELENIGVDGLNITGGWHETRVPQLTMDVPRGAFSYLAKRVKEKVNIPVITSNRLDATHAQSIIERRDADFVGICRGLIADPELVNKAETGRLDLIRPCIGCNQGCMDNIFKGKRLECLVNAEVQYEKVKNLDSAIAVKGKQILVIGSGVAGAEYALRATTAGATVTIWDKDSKSGGQMELVAAPPGRKGFKEIANFHYNACLEKGVHFVFNKKATPDEIINLTDNGTFDIVIVATGATPIIPRIPMEDGAHVVSSWDVLLNKVTTGKNIVVVGGGAVGVETSLLLAEEGTIDAETLKFLFTYKVETPERLHELLTYGSKKVTLVEMMKKIGADIGVSTRWIMLGGLRRLHVNSLTETKVIAIHKDGVLVQDSEGLEELIPADTVVMAIGSRSNNTLYNSLLGKVPKLLLLGDAVKPRKAMDAIRDGFISVK